MKKRLCSILLLVTLFVLLFSVEVYAADSSALKPFPAESTHGINVIFTYSDGTITIRPEKEGDYASYRVFWNETYDRDSVHTVVLGEGLKSAGGFGNFRNLKTVSLPSTLEGIEVSAFQGTALTQVDLPSSLTYLAGFNRSAITSINIPASVTEIGPLAFAYTDLTEVVIPDGVTTIGEKAFYGCTELTKVVIPDSVTEIGESAFFGCASLTSVELPASLQTIEAGLFSDCSALETVIIPDSVTSIGGSAFQNCVALKDIVLPSGVTGIGGSAFRNCVNLESIVIPAGVKEIAARTFRGCVSLDSITIPEAVIRIEQYAFYGCTGLTGIKLPETLKYLEQFAFGNCYSLKEIVLPGNLTEIKASVFVNCRSLEKVTIPATVTKINGSFGNCTKLTDVFYQGTKEQWKAIAQGKDPCLAEATLHCSDWEPAEGSDFGYCGAFWLYDADNDTLEVFGGSYINSYDGGDEIPWADYLESVTAIVISDGVTDIGRNAFEGCGNLTSLSLGNTVQKIGQYAFACDYGHECQVKELVLPGSLKSIERGAFEFWGGLTEVTIPDSVTALDGFGWCTSLTEVTIPDSVTKIGYEAFKGCGLKKVQLPATITEIPGECFDGCSELTEIIIPDDVTKIGYEAFDGCDSLTEITIPNGVTEIGRNAFSGCDNLTAVVIPDSVEVIGSEVFRDCIKLTSIKLPDSITELGGGLFYNCERLKAVNIPANATGIPSEMFYNCISLTELTVPANIENIQATAFTGCTALKELTVSSDNQHYFSDDSGVVYNKEQTEIVFVPLQISGAIVLPDTITDIPSGVFENRMQITSIRLPAAVTIGDGAFSGCCGLIDVYYGGTLREWLEQNIVSNNEDLLYADLHCSDWDLLPAWSYGYCGYDDGQYDGSHLKYVFDEKTATLTIWGQGEMEHFKRGSKYGAVYYQAPPWTDVAESIQHIEVESGVESLGNWAFHDCTALVSVNIPEGVTSIGEDCFIRCEALNSISIPTSLTYVGLNAFDSCAALAKVQYGGTNEQWAAINVKEGNGYLLNAKSGSPVVCVHTVVTDAAIAPTCTDAGKTEGSHCSICNTVIVAQEVVAATGHKYTNGKCEYCGHSTSGTVLLGDMDGNGKVNSDDAIYLLRHTMEPEKYPLH